MARAFVQPGIYGPSSHWMFYNSLEKMKGSYPCPNILIVYAGFLKYGYKADDCDCS